LEEKCTMSAWGSSGAAKSCNTLLTRVERNDPQLKELIILPTKTFGGAELERLASALSQNTNLISISASGHFLPLSSLRTLSQVLKHDAHIKQLAIGDNNLGDEGVAALGGFHDLEKLDLAYKNLGTEGMRFLGAFTGIGGRHLTDLNLARNPKIGDEGLKVFYNGTKSLSGIVLPNLRTFDLSECQIGVEGLKALQKFLVQSSLTNLSLASNPLGPSSCVPLASLFTTAQKIQFISLASCEVGDEGVITLSKNTSQLRQLDLSNNQIGHIGAKALAIALRENWKELLVLRIANNPLGSDGVREISSAINGFEELDLSQTSCGVAGAKSTLLRGIRTLRLFNNQLGSNGFLEIAKLLPKTNIVELDLGGNKANADSMMELLRSLLDVKETSLKVLIIGANQTSMEVEYLVEKVKEIHPTLDVARDKPKEKSNNL